MADVQHYPVIVPELHVGWVMVEQTSDLDVVVYSILRTSLKQACDDIAAMTNLDSAAILRAFLAQDPTQQDTAVTLEPNDLQPATAKVIRSWDTLIVELEEAEWSMSVAPIRKENP